MRTEERLTIVIGEDGIVTCIDSAASRVVMESLGVTTTRRASHVEPDNEVLRWVFHFIRERVADDSALAAWTRGWRCLWRIRLVETFGGNILPERFRDRDEAIAHEVNIINEQMCR